MSKKDNGKDKHLDAFTYMRILGELKKVDVPQGKVSAEMEEAGRSAKELYDSFRLAGFTNGQALDLIVKFVVAGNK